MILRLIIAYGRCVWGVSPAFLSIDRLDEGGVLIIFFGVLLDLLALLGIGVGVYTLVANRKKKNPF